MIATMASDFRMVSAWCEAVRMLYVTSEFEFDDLLTNVLPEIVKLFEYIISMAVHEMQSKTVP